MPRPIRGAKGRFSGSVGDGVRNTPTAAPGAARQTAGDQDAAAMPPLLNLPPVTDPLGHLRQGAVSDMARDPNTDPDMLRLIADHYPLLADQVAANRAAPADLLAELARTPGNDYRSLLWVARHPNTEPEVLAGMPLHPPLLCVELATNPNTPESMLRRLARLDDETTQRRVVSNPNCPADVLERFGKTWFGRARHPRLVLDVAANPNTPGETLRKLAVARTDGFRDVEEVVAANPNTPADVLAAIADQGTPVAHLAALKNPSTPHETLRQHARYAGAASRFNIAQNPAAPGDLLEQMCDETTYAPAEVHPRIAVAANPACPLPRLAALALDPTPAVRSAARRNPRYDTLDEATLVEAALLDL